MMDDFIACTAIRSTTFEWDFESSFYRNSYYTCRSFEELLRFNKTEVGGSIK